MNHQEDHGDMISFRRQFLSGLVGTGATSFAGCTETTSTKDNSVSEDLVSDPEVFGYPFPYLPENVQLNPWAGSFPWSIQGLFFEVQSISVPGGDPVLTPLIKEITIEERTVTVRFAEGFSWWNGRPVTARDQWVAEQINSHFREASMAGNTERLRSGSGSGHEFDRSAQSPAGSMTLEDKFTLRYEFDRPLSNRLAIERVAGNVHNVPAWHFEPWLEELSEAETEDERGKILDDLRGSKLSLETAKEDGIGCGPYELSEVSQNRLILDQFENHPRANTLSISRLWLPVAMDQHRTELISNGDVDGGYGLLDDLRDQPSANIEQLARYPANSGTKLALNWNNHHLAKREVRRALCCLFPLGNIVSAGSWGDPAANQTGLTTPSENRWLDKQFLTTIDKFPVSADKDQATTHMKAAGYVHEDGYWYDEDGNPFSVRLRSPLWDGWTAATDLIEQTLDEFGVKLDVNSMQTATFLGVIESGDFDIVPYWTEGDPYRAYDPTSSRLGTLGYGIDPKTDPTDSETRYGKPIESTVPTEASDESVESIELLDIWETLRSPSTEAETNRAVRTMARWWNYELPDIDVATSVSGVWGNTSRFVWPDSGDARYRKGGPEFRPELQLIKTGAISLADSEV